MLAVPARRVEIAMAPGDAALILRITTRLPEGKLLSAAEIAAVPYELAWLNETHECPAWVARWLVEGDFSQCTPYRIKARAVRLQVEEAAREMLAIGRSRQRRLRYIGWVGRGPAAKRCVPSPPSPPSPSP